MRMYTKATPALFQRASPCTLRWRKFGLIVAMSDICLLMSKSAKPELAFFDLRLVLTFRAPR